MRNLSLMFLLATLLVTPAIAQRRSAPQKELAFPEAIEAAKKAFDAKEHGAAVSALQAAIRAVQKLQRTAILEALPKPDGYEIQDEEAKDEAAPFAVGLTAFGLVVQRHYRKGDDKTIDVEVTANSPIVQMISMMLANSAVLKAEGAELVEYGAHKAMLKKTGENSHELTILMHDKHILKATAQGLSADDLLKVMDQACVDRMEKPLGK